MAQRSPSLMARLQEPADGSSKDDVYVGGDTLPRLSLMHQRHREPERPNSSNDDHQHDQMHYSELVSGGQSPKARTSPG
ncbi:hypothetical protein OK016_00235 [Vibrio chagasii]|nr:hypothetical protein [Vibrio chagasii]